MARFSCASSNTAHGAGIRAEGACDCHIRLLSYSAPTSLHRHTACLSHLRWYNMDRRKHHNHAGDVLTFG